MATPIRVLYSQTSWNADGVTTSWNFSFAGPSGVPYLSRSHVYASKLEIATGVITQIPITPGMWVNASTISIIPAVAAGFELTIFRDTPKDMPLVDFQDKASITERSLDLNARQAIFVAAESSDQLNVAIESVAQMVNYVENARIYSENATAKAAEAAGSAAAAAASASASAGSASSASGSASVATSQAAQAMASATSASGSATSAGNSAGAAGASATAASGSATNAATSATNASNSATNATNQATAAAGSATAAANSAGAAGASATAASGSATAANTSATNAATSATNAANSATAAANSAASIAGGPVASVAGLTGIVSSAALKSAIALDQVDNIAVLPITPYTQCRLVVLSTTSMSLQPYGGSRLWINGALRTLPANTAIAPSGFTTGVVRYVYAFWTGSAVNLEVSTTAPAIGGIVPIKSGDATRTLVGAFVCDTANIFQANLTGSYWNRLPTVYTTALAVDLTLPGPGQGVLGGLQQRVFSWAGDIVHHVFNGTCIMPTAGASNQLWLSVNNATYGGLEELLTPTNGARTACSLHNTRAIVADGVSEYCVIAATPAGGAGAMRGLSEMRVITRQ